MSPMEHMLVRHDETIRRALEVINNSDSLIALVVDDDGVLMGTATDGDIRRGILNGVDLDQPVALVCKRNPVTGSVDESRKEIETRMKTHTIHQVPVVDHSGHVVDVVFADDRFLYKNTKPNLAVLMAGGLGTRLRPLTEDCPKPLLKVGGRPLLERILENFMHDGFHRFVISLGYKGEMIRDYFGNGVGLGCEITYIDEAEPRGTGGALSLIEERPSRPFFVMNGDLLTTLNFVHLLDYHKEHGGVVTMCAKEYTYEVPYGVVESDTAQRVTGLVEKPQHRFLVNAGIYVLDPSCLDFVPGAGRYDMTTLVTQAVDAGRSVYTFPIMENWLDVGRKSDFERAECDYPQFQKGNNGGER